MDTDYKSPYWFESSPDYLKQKSVNEVFYKPSETISFRYKGGRRVKGEVIRIDPKGLLLKLHTDYIGKNEEWYSGENKYFNKAEMKKVSK